MKKSPSFAQNPLFGSMSGLLLLLPLFEPTRELAANMFEHTAVGWVVGFIT